MVVKEKIKDYTVLKIIQENGENANVYLAENDNNEKFIIKEFSKSVKPYVGYSKHNHYGRRREGSELVFSEIREKSSKYKFLSHFRERFTLRKKWYIVIDYFEGETLYKNIIKNKDSQNKIKDIIIEFSKEVKKWHEHNFALGDPHLNNVIIGKNNTVRLIDYSQIHHPDFYCCKKFECFSEKHNRIKEDLINHSGKLGRGFITELQLLEEQIGFNLSEIFETHYK